MNARRRQRLRFETLESRWAPARIEGFVWNDWNRDGYRASPDEEMRVPDVTVRLLSASGSTIAETITDSDGLFGFTGIYDGQYQLEFLPIDDVDFTEPDVGPDNKDSDVDPKTGRTPIFPVEAASFLDTIDAGLYLPGGTIPIRGIVWNDLNGDGVRTDDEPGLRGTEIQLEAVAGGKLWEVDSDPAGNFFFPGGVLLPGNYRLDFRRPQSPPGNWTISPPSSNGSLSPDRRSIADPVNGKSPPFYLPAQADSGSDAAIHMSSGFSRSAEITGTVWHDRVADGRHVVGEPGVFQQTVRLLDQFGNVLASELTDADGLYRFKVDPGIYRLLIELPRGVQLSHSATDPRRDDNDFDATGLTDPFVVSGVDTVVTKDAGVFAPAGTQPVEGVVWHDTNANGQHDPGELGIPGMTVVLEYGGTQPVYQTWTDAQGRYHFPGSSLLPGDYNLNILKDTRLAGWRISPRNPSGHQEPADNDVDPATGQTAPFAVLPSVGQDSLASVVRDAGLFGFATVTGFVWDDADRDHDFSAHERGVPGIAVRLLRLRNPDAAADSDAEMIDELVTDRSGRYTIANLIPGERYALEFLPPPGTRLSSPDSPADTAPTLSTDIVPGTHRTRPFQPLSQELHQRVASLQGMGVFTGVAGIVWDDSNGDGLRDADEAGLADVPVTLHHPDGNTTTTSSDSRGEYLFEELSAGEYTLSIQLPDGATLSPMGRGTSSQLDSDANRATRSIPAFPLLWGQLNDTLDFGVYQGEFANNLADTLRITEVAFIDHGNPEFVEVKNIGSRPISLVGAAFVRGIQFDFAESMITSLFPGEYAVIAGSVAKLEARFDATTFNFAGTYRGDLNRSETLEIRDRQGTLINQLQYDDDWYVLMDDEYLPWTLTVIDEQADAVHWSTRQNWRPSSFQAGSPGTDDPRVTPDPGAVVINEVQTLTVDGFNDLIELHNRTATDIDIGNWYLGDRTPDDAPGANLARYRIAPGTVIPANGYLTFTRETHFANPADPGSLSEFGLSSYGEAIHLVAADSFGNYLGYSDTARFPASEPGMAFGRVPLSDGNSTFVALSGASPGGPNHPPLLGDLVIDMIDYRGDENGRFEFLRVQNRSTVSLDLGHGDSAWSLAGGIDYVFPTEEPMELPPGMFAYIANVSPSLFRAQFGIPAEIPVFGPFERSLNNGGDEVRLERSGTSGRRLVVDRVNYQSDGAWPDTRRETLLPIIRRSTESLGDEPANWILSSTPAGTHLGQGQFMRQSLLIVGAAVHADRLGRSVSRAQAGDADGDGNFTSQDLVSVFQLGGFERPIHVDWTGGDWDGDGYFTTADLVAAFQAGGYLA